MTVSAFELVDDGLKAIIDGTIDIDTDSVVAVLLLSAHTPAPSTESVYSDISANVCVDGDYAPVAVTIPAVSEAAGVVTVDMSQVDFGAAVTIGARYFYLIAGTVPNAGDRIIGYFDLNDGGSIDVESISSDFKVDANASGLFTFSKAA